MKHTSRSNVPEWDQEHHDRTTDRMNQWTKRVTVNDDRASLRPMSSEIKTSLSPGRLAVEHQIYTRAAERVAGWYATGNTDQNENRQRMQVENHQNVQNPINIWYPVLKAPPSTWGPIGWQYSLGLAWLVNSGVITRFDRFLRWIQLFPRFLMCIWCAGHFQSRLETVPVRKGSVFHWMYEAWTAVSERSLGAEDETWTDLWLKDRWRPEFEMMAYYTKRIQRFPMLWKNDVGVFLTTLIRCLPPPEEWTACLASDVSEFLDLHQELIGLKWRCVGQSSVAPTKDAWSNAWHQCLTDWMSNEQDALDIHHTSVHMIPLSPVDQSRP